MRVPDSDRLVRASRPPLPDPRLVRKIIRQRQLRARFFEGDLFADPAWDMATVACPITTRRDLDARTVVKVVMAHDGNALYFSRLPIPCRRDGEPDLASRLYWRHLGIYAYRGAFLKRLVSEPPCALEKTESLEQLRALHIGGRIAVIPTEHAGVGVDTPEDVGYVEAEMRKRGLAK